MNKKELETFAREAAKSIKTEKDLNAFSEMLLHYRAKIEEGIGLDKSLESEILDLLEKAEIAPLFHQLTVSPERC